MKINIDKLEVARWNVHAQVKDSDEAIQGLAESIKQNGVLHAVVAMPSGDGNYTIIDGHRRVQAARIAGMDEIDVVVRDVSDKEAMAMTIAANVQRLENDPILEADTISAMMDSGRSAVEVAAAIGKTERYVRRRVQLTHLASVWRKAAKEKAVTTDALERVSAYDESIQNAAFDTSRWVFSSDDRDIVSWSDIRRSFEGRHRSLKSCAFACVDCASCAMNTANHGFLFPDLDGEKYGTCTDPKCFEKHWNAAIDAKVNDLSKRGIKAKEKRYVWDIPGRSEKKTKKATVPYLVEESGLKRIYWGEKPSANESVKDAKTSKEKKAEKEARLLKKKAEEDVCKWMQENAREKLLACMEANGSYCCYTMLSIEKYLNAFTVHRVNLDRIALDIARGSFMISPYESKVIVEAYVDDIVSSLYTGSVIVGRLFLIFEEELKTVMPPEEFATFRESAICCSGVSLDEGLDRYGSIFKKPESNKED